MNREALSAELTAVRRRICGSDAHFDPYQCGGISVFVCLVIFSFSVIYSSTVAVPSTGYQVVLIGAVSLLLLMATFGQRLQANRDIQDGIRTPVDIRDKLSGFIFYGVYGTVFLCGFGLLLDRMGALRSGIIGLLLAILGGMTAKTFVWIMARRTTIERSDGVICTYSVWAKLRGIDEPTTCTICLNEIAPSERIHALRQCGHVFHAHCLKGWFCAQQTTTSTCPLCRGEQPLDEIPQDLGTGPWPALPGERERRSLGRIVPSAEDDDDTS